MLVQQRFFWDPRKNQINIVKHHVSFSKAAKIFDGPRLEKEDTRRDYGEKRMLALGRSEGRILRVVYTQRSSSIRIISARKATLMKEQNIYVEYSRSEIDAQSDEKEWSRFEALTDAEIDAAAASDADDPKTDIAFWKEATVAMPENIVTIDQDLLVWFKAHAPEYETQINAVLRTYVEAKNNT